jgi:hypothetical protein
MLVSGKLLLDLGKMAVYSSYTCILAVANQDG